MTGVTTSGVGTGVRGKIGVDPKRIGKAKYKALESITLELSNTSVKFCLKLYLKKSE